MTEDKESDKKRIEKIRNTLSTEEQKDSDLMMQATEKYKGLFKRLAKT